MGSEVWVFKSTKLTTKTKKQRGWIFKNAILKKRRRRKKKKSQELLKTTTTATTKKYIYGVCFKNLKIEKC